MEWPLRGFAKSLEGPVPQYASLKKTLEGLVPQCASLGKTFEGLVPQCAGFGKTFEGPVPQCAGLEKSPKVRAHSANRPRSAVKSVLCVLHCYSSDKNGRGIQRLRSVKKTLPPSPSSPTPPACEAGHTRAPVTQTASTTRQLHPRGRHRFPRSHYLADNFSRKPLRSFKQRLSALLG
jgi:hypothetical protein